MKRAAANVPLAPPRFRGPPGASSIGDGPGGFLPTSDKPGLSRLSESPVAVDFGPCYYRFHAMGAV